MGYDRCRRHASSVNESLRRLVGDTLSYRQRVHVIEAVSTSMVTLSDILAWQSA